MRGQEGGRPCSELQADCSNAVAVITRPTEKPSTVTSWPCLTGAVVTELQLTAANLTTSQRLYSSTKEAMRHHLQEIDLRITEKFNATGLLPVISALPRASTAREVEDSQALFEG